MRRLIILGIILMMANCSQKYRAEVNGLEKVKLGMTYDEVSKHFALQEDKKVFKNEMKTYGSSSIKAKDYFLVFEFEKVKGKSKWHRKDPQLTAIKISYDESYRPDSKKDKPDASKDLLQIEGIPIKTSKKKEGRYVWLKADWEAESLKNLSKQLGLNVYKTEGNFSGNAYYFYRAAAKDCTFPESLLTVQGGYKEKIHSISIETKGRCSREKHIGRSIFQKTQYSFEIEPNYSIPLSKSHNPIDKSALLAKGGVNFRLGPSLKSKIDYGGMLGKELDLLFHTKQKTKVGKKSDYWYLTSEGNYVFGALINLNPPELTEKTVLALGEKHINKLTSVAKQCSEYSYTIRDDEPGKSRESEEKKIRKGIIKVRSSVRAYRKQNFVANFIFPKERSSNYDFYYAYVTPANFDLQEENFEIAIANHKKLSDLENVYNIEKENSSYAAKKKEFSEQKPAIFSIKAIFQINPVASKGDIAGGSYDGAECQLYYNLKVRQFLSGYLAFETSGEEKAKGRYKVWLLDTKLNKSSEPAFHGVGTTLESTPTTE